MVLGRLNNQGCDSVLAPMTGPPAPIHISSLVTFIKVSWYWINRREIQCLILGMQRRSTIIDQWKQQHFQLQLFTISLHHGIGYHVLYKSIDQARRRKILLSYYSSFHSSGRIFFCRWFQPHDYKSLDMDKSWTTVGLKICCAWGCGLFYLIYILWPDRCCHLTFKSPYPFQCFQRGLGSTPDVPDNTMSTNLPSDNEMGRLVGHCVSLGQTTSHM